MKTSDLTFNLLNFNHPTEELTFFFTDKEQDNLCRVYHTLVPDELIQHFGQQEHYYTSFTTPNPDFFSVKKLTQSAFCDIKKKYIPNSAFKRSLLKRYYNAQIHNYFQSNAYLVKPHFIADTEVWIPLTTKDEQY